MRTNYRTKASSFSTYWHYCTTTIGAVGLALIDTAHIWFGTTATLHIDRFALLFSTAQKTKAYQLMPRYTLATLVAIASLALHAGGVSTDDTAACRPGWDTTCQDNPLYISRLGLDCAMHLVVDCELMVEIGFTAAERDELIMNCPCSCQIEWYVVAIIWMNRLLFFLDGRGYAQTSVTFDYSRSHT